VQYTKKEHVDPGSTHIGIVAAGDQWRMSDKIKPYRIWVRTLSENGFRAGCSDMLLQRAISRATVSATRNLYLQNMYPVVMYGTE